MIKKDRQPEMAANIRRFMAEVKRPPKRRLSDQELNRAAVDKLRTQLFSKYSAKELGIVLVSERISPLIRTRSREFPDRFGGLEYLLIHSICHKIWVMHQGEKMFLLSLFVTHPMAIEKEVVKKSFEIEFKDLDWMIMKALIVASI